MMSGWGKVSPSKRRGRAPASVVVGLWILIFCGDAQQTDPHNVSGRVSRLRDSLARSFDHIEGVLGRLGKPVAKGLARVGRTWQFGAFPRLQIAHAESTESVVEGASGDSDTNLGGGGPRSLAPQGQ